MLRRSVVPALLAVLGGMLIASVAAAQLPGPGRVLEALDATDRRIEFADGIVPASGNPGAAAELGFAHQIQARARGAYAAAQYVFALRATIEARNHADRSIALVRGLPDPERVAVQIERTRDLIDRARERLDSCDDPRARALLRVALEMQGRAELAGRESRFLAALQLTMSARERVLRALRTCKVEESLQDAATRAIRRTDDVLSRVREAVEAAGVAAAKQILQRAVGVQADAQAELGVGRHESALRLTQTARVMAQRAQRVAREGGDGVAH